MMITLNSLINVQYILFFLSNLFHLNALLDLDPPRLLISEKSTNYTVSYLHRTNEFQTSSFFKLLVQLAPQQYFFQLLSTALRK